MAVGAGVSEEIEGQDTGAEAAGAGADPAAIALALGVAAVTPPFALARKLGDLR